MTFLSATGYWLLDFYTLATFVLLATFAVFQRLHQPARRLSAAWAAIGGVAALAVITAIPVWPRSTWLERQMRPAPDHSAATLNTTKSAPSPIPEAAPQSPLQSHAPADLGSIEPAPPDRSTGPIGMSPRVPGAAASTSARPDWATVSQTCYLAGALLMLVWLAVGHYQTTSVRRGSAQAPDWIKNCLKRVVGDERQLPELRVSDRLAQPVAVGLVRPSIILPSQLAAQSAASRLDRALAHEWAHIRNRDLWLIALSRLLMPILFAHPGYWWLRGRIRDDQEMLADAAASTDDRVDYAGALLLWARSAPDRPRLAMAGSLALWERPSQLKRRIKMLLNHDFRVELTCPSSWRFGIRFAMALAVLSLSVFSFRPPPVLGLSRNGPAPERGTNDASPKSDEKAAAGETVRVFDSRGNPAAGVKFYRTDTVYRGVYQQEGKAILLGESGPDGSFRLSAQDVKAANERTIQIVAMADGSGPALADPTVKGGVKELRLAADDVPIRGRVLDINGQGVAGASVQLIGIFSSPSGKLDEWLAALNAEKVAYPVWHQTLRSWTSMGLPSLYKPVMTDREGRFTLSGVGRERLASLLISGPRIETRCEYAVTRAMRDVKVPDFNRQNQSQTVTYRGAELDLVAGPSVEVTGSVSDKDTGKPIAGAVVQMATAFGNPHRYIRTTTDQAGRYRLTGIPPKNKFGQTDDVLAAVPDGPPYLQSVQSLNEQPGNKPVTRDFALKRGVVARGRVTDKLTGKPIKANLSYYILEDNPYLKEYPPYGTVRAGMPYPCDEDGNFQIVVMPGRGVLGARHGNQTYRLGVGLANIKGLTEAFPGGYRTRPSYLSPMNYNMLVEINAKPGDEFVKADMQFDHGQTLKGTLLGPGGEPVSGALMLGAEDYFQVWGHQALPSAEFEVHALGADSKRGLLFLHEAKKLAGAHVVQPGETGPLEIKLEPWGELTGRLMKNGTIAGLQMTCDRPYENDDARYEHGSLPGAIKPDKSGRFHVVGLVPGLKYSLRVWQGNRIIGEAAKDVVVKPGERRELGDLAMKE